MNQPTPPARSYDTLSAREAAELLGVKLSTLYAYVSRGKLQSTPSPDSRGRRYLRADVERLRARRGRPEERGALPGSALRWGDPVLESAISQITPEGPLYRGCAAVDLAREGIAYEVVAERLWTGTQPEHAAWTADGFGLDVERVAALLPPSPAPLSVLAAVVPLLGAQDPGRFDRRPPAVLARARVLIRRLAAALALTRDDPAAVGPALQAPTLAQGLAHALGVKGARRAAALNQTLVLWADHELNASSFAARVAASADADLYACVSAGLAALAGPRHGAASEQVEALVAEANAPEQAERTVHARLRRGEALPGFGHPLYPGGDPRATPLLETARALTPRSMRLRTVTALVEAVAALDGPPPTIDVGLVAMTTALGLPPGSGPGLFAVGRCAGWVAHALEQYEAGFLIRPRARWTGEGALT
jgi:citrate synthase